MFCKMPNNINQKTPGKKTLQISAFCHFRQFLTKTKFQLDKWGGFFWNTITLQNRKKGGPIP